MFRADLHSQFISMGFPRIQRYRGEQLNIMQALIPSQEKSTKCMLVVQDINVLAIIKYE